MLTLVEFRELKYCMFSRKRSEARIGEEWRGGGGIRCFWQSFPKNTCNKMSPKNPQIDPRVGVNHDRMLWAGRQTDGWRDGLTDGRTSLSYFQSDLVFFLTFLLARLVAWLLDCKEKNGLKFLFLK